MRFCADGVEFGGSVAVRWKDTRVEPRQRLRTALSCIAERSDPLSPPIHNNLAHVLMVAGRYDEAASHCEKLPANFVYKGNCLGQARFWQGRTDEAIQILASAGNRGFLCYVYARTGRREEAERLAAAGPPNPLNQAQMFAGLDDKDRTLEALDRHATAGPFQMGRDLTRPEFALLRGDPRLKALRKKVGLPE